MWGAVRREDAAPFLAASSTGSSPGSSTGSSVGSSMGNTTNNTLHTAAAAGPLGRQAPPQAAPPVAQPWTREEAAVALRRREGSVAPGPVMAMGHDGAAMVDRGPMRPRRTIGTAQNTEAVVV